MSGLTRRSALAHRAALEAPGGAAVLRERPFEGKLILRGALTVVGDPVAGVLGVTLPAKVYQTAVSARANVQWLSPDEWLIVTPPGAETALAADLAAALGGKHAQVVDVSDYYTTIELLGARAREMLMKIATVDFDPRAYKPGMCVATNFGRTVAWARQTGEDGYDLIVRISMADYLWCLLAEAGHEWGLPAQEPKGGKVKLHLPHLEADALSLSGEPAADLEIT